MSAESAVEIRLGPPLPRGLPALGLALSAADVPFAVARRAWIAEAAPRFVMLPVRAADAAVDLLQGLHRVAQATEAQALLRAQIEPGAARASLEALAARVAQARLRLSGLVLARFAPEPVDSTDLQTARELFPHIRVDAVGDVATPGGIAVHSPERDLPPDAQLERAARIVHRVARAARGAAWAVAPCGPADLFHDGSPGPLATPVFHAFAGLARASGTTRIAVEASDPAGVEALVHRINGGLRLWIANRTARPRRATAPGLPAGRARLRALDASSVASAARNAESFDVAAVTCDPTGPIDLGPHAIAVVELEFDETHPI